MSRLAHSFGGSTRLRRGWYDPDTMTVELEFSDYAHVLYRGVPRSVWDALLDAKSAGRFVTQILERYPFQRR